MNATRHFRYESASVVLRPRENYMIVANLYSISPGLGHASKLMEIVTKWADENSTNLMLVPKQYGNPNGLTDVELERFYSKYGFVPLPALEKFPMFREHGSQ